MDKKTLFFSGIFCFLVGIISSGLYFSAQKSLPEISIQEIRPEISLVRFTKIEGDSLLVDVSGPVRLIWGESMKEGDGVSKIPLGQFENKFDAEFKKYPYTGNTKTMKFYPSDTYWARGVEVRHRRFFRTKEKALAEGFIPTKALQ